MQLTFQLFSARLLEEYKKSIPPSQLNRLVTLTESELSNDDFSFYTSVAAVYSSKIEGEPIELDSYIKFKRFGVEFLPDYTKKTNDLYNAYQFAKTKPLTFENILECHRLLTQNLLPATRRGKIRRSNMFVTTNDGKIEYIAVPPFELEGELKKFSDDLSLLQSKELDPHGTFFFASQLHLVFVKIHPYEDGNGRISRLIEKWFLAEKLGEKAWFVESEKYYYENHHTYYHNLRALGLEYENLDYIKALPFLQMLAKSLGT